MMKSIAKAWYDDPDGTHKKTIDDGMRLFYNKTISGYEMGQIRRVAGECRDQAKAENAKRVEKKA